MHFYHGSNTRGLCMLFASKLPQSKSHCKIKVLINEVFFASFNDNSKGLEPLESGFRVCI